MNIPKVEDIKIASKILSAILNDTPLIYSYAFSGLFSGNIYIKLENFQKTGSFKIRGLYYKLYKLTKEEKKRGISIAYHKNLAKSISYTSNILNIPNTIIVPESLHSDTDTIKYIERHGSKIIFHGITYRDTVEYAKKIADKNNLIYINPINDPDIIAGYGTIGLEILKEEKSLDTIIVPVKYGMLISGIGIAIKEILPQIDIIGVINEDNHSITENLPPLVRAYIDEIISVEERDIYKAIKLLLEDTKILVEEKGAMPLAALLSGKIKTQNKSIGLIATGGNMALNRLSEILKNTDLKNHKKGL